MLIWLHFSIQFFFQPITVNYKGIIFSIYTTHRHIEFKLKTYKLSYHEKKKNNNILPFFLFCSFFVSIVYVRPFRAYKRIMHNTHYTNTYTLYMSHTHKYYYMFSNIIWIGFYVSIIASHRSAFFDNLILTKLVQKFILSDVYFLYGINIGLLTLDEMLILFIVQEIWFAFTFRKTNNMQEI